MSHQKSKKVARGAGDGGVGGRGGDVPASSRSSVFTVLTCRVPLGSGSRGGEPEFGLLQARRSGVSRAGCAEVDVRASSHQQPDDIDVEVHCRRTQRCAAGRVLVVHGGVRRALEYHAHDLYVPVRSRYHEGRSLGGGGLEGWPLRSRGVPPAGSSLLTAAALPSRHALYSAWPGMCGTIFPLGSRRTERFGGMAGVAGAAAGGAGGK